MASDSIKDQSNNANESTLSAEARSLLHRPIDLTDLYEGKDRMKRGRASGLDGIPIECVLGVRGADPEEPDALVSPIDEILLETFNQVLTTCVFPDAWRRAALVPLLKGGALSAHEPNNYRGIALLNTISKLFCNILEHRLSRFQWECSLICDEQFGFTEGRMALDGMFVLDTLIDSVLATGKNLYVAFIDFQKAYDFVPRDALFYKMIRMHMNSNILRVICNMYAAVESVVQCGVSRSEVIYQMIGLRQGCILSPCLFSLYISDLPRYVADQSREHKCK
jgi:hypothetical protein